MVLNVVSPQRGQRHVCACIYASLYISHDERATFEQDIEFKKKKKVSESMQVKGEREINTQVSRLNIKSSM